MWDTKRSTQVTSDAYLITRTDQVHIRKDGPYLVGYGLRIENTRTEKYKYWKTAKLQKKTQVTSAVIR